MIEESAAFLPIWMVISAAFGFMIGEAYGDQARHRKCLEQANADLRDQLQTSQPCASTVRCDSNNSAASSTTYTSASSL
jgi:hypothetical protein